MFSHKETIDQFNALNDETLNNIPNRQLRRRAKQLKKKQGGFTLLELLVVVGILAAIAGTAVVAMQDTEARASAAAHVAMMDELDKGIRTFAEMNGAYPNRFDSIMQSTAAVGLTGTAQISIAAHEDLAVFSLANIVTGDDNSGDPGCDNVNNAAAGAGIVDRLCNAGIEQVRVAYDSTNGGLDPDGDGDCDDYTTLIESRGNAVVAGNIFMSPAANGCGADHTLAPTSNVMVWGGGTERITGQPITGTNTDFDGTNMATAQSDLPVLMALGVGPNTSLFDKRLIGSLSSVPVYRHVGPAEYNRFTALFQIAETNGSATPDGLAQIHLVSIVDGAGDTKEEELGEWDGTRNTI